jgi:hypothetical protein
MVGRVSSGLGCGIRRAACQERKLFTCPPAAQPRTRGDVGAEAEAEAEADAVGIREPNQS